MYTQCPDCGTSFRVTAEALKQAAGKVRCGGCGNAFNALAYLSETRPDKATRIEVDESLPELMPEPGDDEVDIPPTAISPEQSAALLKTLDQLAGENIRLKDTGVEWRVLDDDDKASDDAPVVDQLLENTPTEVDEFLTKTPTSVDASEIFKAPVSSDVDAAEIFEGADDPATQSRAEELRFDDDTGVPDDFDFEIPSAPPVLAEEPEAESDDESEPDDAHVDLALGDPDEWGELLEEVDGGEPAPETAQAEDESSPMEAAAADAVDTTDEGGSDESMLDIDTQFGMQAEAMGIDISGAHETVPAEKSDSEVETSIDEDLIAAAFENEAATPDAADDADTDDDVSFKDTENLEVRLEDVLETVSVKTKDSDGQPVPTPAEEEKTINMQIDEELLAVAVQDPEGFASTIRMDSKELEKKGLEAKDDVDVPEDTVVLDEKGDGHQDTAATDDEDEPPEEIVMSGKFTRSAEEAEQIALHKEKEDGVPDSGFVHPVEEAPKYQPPAEGALKSRLLAGVAVLALVLIGQIIHQSRTAIATMPGIGGAIAPIYRAVGAPIAPEWDVTGWRFEISKGSTDPAGGAGDNTAEDEEVLTIYSRIGNQSDSSLPYPLISVALTDRFEEIIGSKVLEPNEYLGGDFDPRVLVASGDTFNAVISIDTPVPEATGFKLNVCYRQSGGLLRCAIDDFK